MPWRGPEYEGEVPTLGYQVLDWIFEYLIVPDGPTAGQPLELTSEQAMFVLNFYRVDPNFAGPAIQGRSMINARTFNRAILCRPKGWGKSPLLGALSFVEALAPVVLDGWDAYGEPVAREWTSFGFKAKVQILATAEDQTANTWDPMLEMARNSSNLMYDYGVEPMETFIGVPRGKIEYATSAGDTREGGRPIFAVMDQTESWRQGNGGKNLAAAVRRNLTKTQGSSIESPNAYKAGTGTVAESSFKAHAAQQAKKRNTMQTILLDHREAPEDTDPYDDKSLRLGLGIAYGDSADVNGGWVALDRVVEDFWDPDTEPDDARRFFLNQLSAAGDQWISKQEWSQCLVPVGVGEMPAKRQIVTLGFDGSRGRTRGVTDSTALIGCHVRTGMLFEIGVWEQPKGWDSKRRGPWKPPIEEVDAKVAWAFKQWQVVGFFADPAMWETRVADWEAQFAKDLKVKASSAHPIEWWMTGRRALATVKALETFHNAVIDQELLHNGSPILTAHITNARMRESRSGVQIAKESPTSPNKIDAAVAAVLAWQARMAALAAGVLNVEETFVPTRIR